MGGSQMTLWMGQDGFDYSFQADYARMWDDTVAAIAEVADHNPRIDIAVEYKPNEPRAHALMPDMAKTLLALDEVGRANTGVTLDFAHMLYAGEMPARAATLAARRSRILGLHLNDGYGKRDDGLMAGSVHPVQTVDQARANVRLTDRLVDVAARLAVDPALQAAQARQDGAAVTLLVMGALLGA
jgi:xylose isomerase